MKLTAIFLFKSFMRLTNCITAKLKSGMMKGLRRNRRCHKKQQLVTKNYSFILG